MEKNTCRICEEPISEYRDYCRLCETKGNYEDNGWDEYPREPLMPEPEPVEEMNYNNGL